MKDREEEPDHWSITVRHGRGSGRGQADERGRRGPGPARGMLTPDQVGTYQADALVDTGAVRTVIPPQVAARLGLGVRGQRMAEYADGRTKVVDFSSGGGSALTRRTRLGRSSR